MYFGYLIYFGYNFKAFQDKFIELSKIIEWFGTNNIFCDGLFVWLEPERILKYEWRWFGWWSIEICIEKIA